MFDPVSKPSHYSADRRFEVIEVLEDWASRAPDPVLGGLLMQTCKYLGRLFDKGNALQDAKKARWYLDRLISKLEASPLPPAPPTSLGDIPPSPKSSSPSSIDQLLAGIVDDFEFQLDPDSYFEQSAQSVPFTAEPEELGEAWDGGDIEPAPAAAIQDSSPEVIQVIQKRGFCLAVRSDGTTFETSCDLQQLDR